MRAVRNRDDGVEVIEVESPSGDGVRIRVASAGICGSDLHLVARDIPLRATLGHEVAGWLPDGRPVAIEPFAPCGQCETCTRDAYNLCSHAPATVIGTVRDGGMADEVLVSERSLVPLGSGLEARDACLVEPLAVAVHGLRLAVAARPFRDVAIVGGGTMGLCAVAALKDGGLTPELAARHDPQREAGRRLGARPLEAGAFDLVIDAAGTRSALEQAVSLCRPGATLLLLGTYWDGFELPGMPMMMKETRIQPTFPYSTDGTMRDVDKAASLLATHGEIAAALITHRFPLDAAPEAFRVAADRAQGAIKVVLEP